MKRVTFKVAKALKAAGYSQGKTKDVYIIRDKDIYLAYTPNYYHEGEVLTDYYTRYLNHQSYHGVHSDDIADIPTYFEVWEWLWVEKKTTLGVTPGLNNSAICTNIFVDIDGENPEDAIRNTIDFLVSKNLIK